LCAGFGDGGQAIATRVRRPGKWHCRRGVWPLCSGALRGRLPAGEGGGHPGAPAAQPLNSTPRLPPPGLSTPRQQQSGQGHYITRLLGHLDLI